MRKIYQELLAKEGMDKDNEMYRNIDRVFNTSSKALQRQRQEMKENNVKLCRLSRFMDEEGFYLDNIPSEEDIEERIIHEIELDALRECLSKLSVEDQELLFRVYGYGRGEITKIATERNVSYMSVYRRIRKLITVLRKMMEDRDF